MERHAQQFLTHTITAVGVAARCAFTIRIRAYPARELHHALAVGGRSTPSWCHCASYELSITLFMRTSPIPVTLPAGVPTGSAGAHSRCFTGTPWCTSPISRAAGSSTTDLRRGSALFVPPTHARTVRGCGRGCADAFRTRCARRSTPSLRREAHGWILSTGAAPPLRYGEYGAWFVRWAASRAARRRTVLTVPEMTGSSTCSSLGVRGPASVPAWPSRPRYGSASGGLMSMRSINLASNGPRGGRLPTDLDLLRCASYVTHLIEFTTRNASSPSRSASLCLTTAIYTHVSDEFRTR